MPAHNLLVVNAAAMVVALLAILWLSKPLSLYVQTAAWMIGCGAVAIYVQQSVRHANRRRRELKMASEQRTVRFRRLLADFPGRRSGDSA